MSAWISVADRLPDLPGKRNGADGDLVILLVMPGKDQPPVVTRGWRLSESGWFGQPWRIDDWDEHHWGKVIAWQAHPEGDELARLIERAGGVG